MQGEVEDAGELPPVKDDNDAVRKSGPRIIMDSSFLHHQ